MNRVPREAGKSSFDIISKEMLMNALPASGVDSILDFGCGVGNYLFALAEHYPEAGELVGVDLWGEGIDILNQRARQRGAPRVRGVTASGLDLDFIGDGQVDLLLMATVLHDLAERKEEVFALEEVSRVIRPGGTLAVVEYKKIETMRGPPVSIRISEAELPVMVGPFGFAEGITSDLGTNCYISTFSRNGKGEKE